MLPVAKLENAKRVLWHGILLRCQIFCVSSQSVIENNLYTSNLVSENSCTTSTRYAPFIQLIMLWNDSSHCSSPHKNNYQLLHILKVPLHSALKSTKNNSLNIHWLLSLDWVLSGRDFCTSIDSAFNIKSSSKCLAERVNAIPTY